MLSVSLHERLFTEKHEAISE